MSLWLKSMKQILIECNRQLKSDNRAQNYICLVVFEQRSFLEHPVKIEIIQNDLTDFFPFRFYIEQYRDFVQEFKKGKKNCYE